MRQLPESHRASQIGSKLFSQDQTMKGRRALITGGSRGLGKALSHKLAQNGASITLVARNAALLKETAATLPKPYNQHHRILPLDLLDLHKLNQLNSQVFEDVSILINCAGMTNHLLLSRTSPTEIANTINLNLTVPILLSKLAIKPMLKSKSEVKPVILNVSSILSSPDVMVPGTSVYSALKAGLNGFTKSISCELRQRIRVNSILPGLIAETDMGAGIKHEGVTPVSLDTVVQKCIEIIEDESINGECIDCNV